MNKMWEGIVATSSASTFRAICAIALNLSTRPATKSRCMCQGVSPSGRKASIE